MPLKIKRLSPDSESTGKRRKNLRPASGSRRAFEAAQTCDLKRTNLQRRRFKLHRVLAHRHETDWETQMNLAQKIQKHRKAHRLTQEELAEALDVSHQSISKWESGQTTPGLDKVLLLSEFFQVSTDYLLKGTAQKDETCQNDTPPASTPPSPPLPSPFAPSPPAQPPLLPTPSLPPTREKRFPLLRYLGIFLTAMGCAGIILLWVLSILNPPYTLGKTLGPIEMFSFYIRYHEMETHLKLAGVTGLIGVALMVLHRLWKRR